MKVRQYINMIYEKSVTKVMILNNRNAKIYYNE